MVESAPGWICGVIVACLASCTPLSDSGDSLAAKAGAVRAGRSRGSGENLMRFADMTARSGIDFVYRDGREAGLWTMLEAAGGGVAAFDFDGDHRVDVFFPGGGGFPANGQVKGRPSALFRNTGDWRFTRVPDAAGAGQAPYYSFAAVAGDYDNDGFPDVLVTGYGGLLLFQNNGDGTFSETAQAAGLTDSLWSLSAAWGDVNGDSHPDLYVARYVDWSFENHAFCAGAGPERRELCTPNEFDPLPDALYLSNGDGTFRDGSREAGLRGDGKGMGVLLADIDRDGRVDIYVANDVTPNFLYFNRGTLPLEEVGLRSGTAVDGSGEANGSMGVDLGDFNGDGWPDLGISNFEQEDFALYRGAGSGQFQCVSRHAGLAAVAGLYVGWGTHFADFDRDGDEDLFISNGHVFRNPTRSESRQRPLLLENVRSESFVKVAVAGGDEFAEPRSGRGSALADFDNDGDPDLAVSCMNEPVRLFSNESMTRNHGLVLRLIGTRSSRDAVGAVVRVTTRRGVQMRQVKGGGSFASSSDSRLFFGLGEHAAVEHIEIQWPSGVIQQLPGRAVNQTIVVVERDIELRQ